MLRFFRAGVWLAPQRTQQYLPVVRRIISSSASRHFGSPTKICPSCSQPLATSLPVCTSCWYISALPSTTPYHELFNLSERPNPFVIDIPTLKRRFRETQALCHPDTWASKGSDKQDIAHRLSSFVNNAYQHLLKPRLRAEYLLERNNHPLSETDQLNDVVFISEIMEAREEIDSSRDPGLIRSVLEKNDEKMQDELALLEEQVAKQDWPAVKATTIRLKYLEGIEQAAGASLDSM